MQPAAGSTPGDGHAARRPRRAHRLSGHDYPPPEPRSSTVSRCSTGSLSDFGSPWISVASTANDVRLGEVSSTVSKGVSWMSMSSPDRPASSVSAHNSNDARRIACMPSSLQHRQPPWRHSSLSPNSCQGDPRQRNLHHSVPHAAAARTLQDQRRACAPRAPGRRSAAHAPHGRRPQPPSRRARPLQRRLQ